jgi:hypothetical protein
MSNKPLKKSIPMPIVYYRSIGKTSEEFSLDVQSTATVSDLCDILADRHSVPRSTVRLVHRAKLLDPSTPVNSLSSSPDNRIAFYGKKSGEVSSSDGRDSNPPPPSSSPPSSLSPPPSYPQPSSLSQPMSDQKVRGAQGQLISMADAIESLEAMGFCRSDCVKAIQLCPVIDIAANLLLSGDISEAGLRALRTDPRSSSFNTEGVCCAILGNPEYFEIIRSGTTVHLDSIGVDGLPQRVSVTPDQLNAYLMQTHGVPLSDFQPDYARMQQMAWSQGYVADGASHAAQKMEGIWALVYQRMPMQEKAMVNAMVQEGFNFTIAFQVFVGCGRNVEAARNTLRALFSR